MGSDRYCLRWNNHQNNLLGVFSQLLQEESLVDVTLACSEGHSIRAHKVVLSACSSYFQSLFLDHPSRHPIIILKDVCFAELRTLVEFMYRGEVNLDYCQLPTFLRTAKSLQVKGLTEMTHLRSSLSPDSDIFRSTDGQSRRDKLPSSVIATTTDVAVSTAHEPLPLIRRCSRSPNDAEISEKISTDTAPQTIHHLSPPNTSASATTSSPARSPGAVGFETSQSHSPPSRLPVSVSPHLADTSSTCDDQRSMTPDPDDDVSSIHSGPSDMTIGSQISSPQCLKAVPGPSNFPPEQQVPLSLKKEPNNSNWDKNEERSCGGNGGSDFSINRHLSDSDRDRELDKHAVFTCTYCGAAFPHQSKLTRHILSHSLDSLKYREQSQPHLQYAPHHSGISLIENATESEWSGLRTPLLELPHDSQASDAAESPGAVCKFCGKAFPDVSSLISHLPAHTGDRPFKCEYCGKAFKLRHHMKDHCRVHTGERPFRCSLCGKTFSRSTILKAHEKTHYPKYVRKFLSSPSPDEEQRPPDLPLPCDLSLSENNVEASTSAPPMFMHRPTPSPSP